MTFLLLGEALRLIEILVGSLLVSSFVVALGACSPYDGIEAPADPPEGPLEVPTPAPTPFNELREGFWGNGVARLEVKRDSAHLELGCAKGDVMRKIILGKQNTFAELGTYSLEGGAEPDGGFPIYQALYSGRVSGSMLRLRVAYVKDDHTYASTHDLYYRAEALPLKCR